jgi:hypothetical protein
MGMILQDRIDVGALIRGEARAVAKVKRNRRVQKADVSTNFDLGGFSLRNIQYIVLAITAVCAATLLGNVASQALASLPRLASGMTGH